MRTPIEPGIYKDATKPDRLYIVVRDERGKQKWTTLKRGTKETKRGAVPETQPAFQSRAHKEREAQLKSVADGASLAIGSGTLAATFDAWKESHFDNLAPRTRGFYSGLFDSYIGPALGHRKLKDLKVAHVDALYADMNKRGLSAVTRRHCARTLNTLLSWAVLHDHAARNVAKGIRIAKSPSADEDATEGLPDDQAIARILAEASKEGPMVAALARTLLYTGARLGEALALTWGKEGVDLDKRTMKIARARTGLSESDRDLYKADVFGETKNKWSKRTLRLDAETVAILDAWRRAQTMRSVDGLVFTRADGSGLTHQAADCLWLRVTQRAGVSGMNAHKARHWHASYMIRAGIPITTVSERLGHRNAGITLSLYSHALKGGDGDVVAAIEAAG